MLTASVVHSKANTASLLCSKHERVWRVWRVCGHEAELNNDNLSPDKSPLLGPSRLPSQYHPSNMFLCQVALGGRNTGPRVFA